MGLLVVRQRGWDNQRPVLALAHLLEPGLPSPDHLVFAKREGKRVLRCNVVCGWLKKKGKKKKKKAPK